jgi:hypothetical protein
MSLYPIFPELRSGNISIFASHLRGDVGHLRIATSGIMALSSCNSPSIIASILFSCNNSFARTVASCTFVTIG